MVGMIGQYVQTSNDRHRRLAIVQVRRHGVDGPKVLLLRGRIA